jgi:putative PIN family toxin of toxin-antitoxin system
LVLDTNALVSALLFGGGPGRLVSLWEKGRIVPLVSKDVLLEYVRVLGYPKFALDAEDITGLITEHLLPFAEMVSVDRAPEVIKEDPADDKFPALAIAGRACFLISGDRHSLALKRYGNVEVLTPRQFLERPELSEE